MTDPRSPQALAALIRMVVGGEPAFDNPLRLLVDHQWIVEIRRPTIEDYNATDDSDEIPWD